MASKFQNRLLGTVALVALAVIILPAILDGHKKHYQDDFTAIPLVAKPGDQHELDLLPSVNQALPAQPPEGAAEEIKAGNAAAPSAETVRQAANNGLAVNPSLSATIPPPDQAGDDEIAALLRQKYGEPAAEKPAANTPPAGKAYVVQLGALKNADNVNRIVAKLRTAGYRVYTIPATPVTGQLTRILVGPEADKNKLTMALADLQRVSGLSGVVKNYNVAE